MPPAFRNQRAPTGADTPAPIAASSLDRPAAINTQKRRRCVCCATGGRPGERSLLRNARSDRRRPAITTLLPRVLRRPIEFTLQTPVGMMHQPATMKWPPIMEGLLQRIEHEACMSRPAGPPADNPASVGIDDESNVDESCPGADVSEVRDPEHVGSRRVELPIDVIQRARGSLVTERCANRFATNGALETHHPHQASDGAAGNIEAFPLHLPPDLAHAVNPEVLPEHAIDLRLQNGIPLCPHREFLRIGALGDMIEIRGRGNRQNLADRLDPMCIALIVDEGDHRLNGRSSSACAKYADALRRISFACRSSRFSRSSAFSFSATSKDTPARLPLSTSAFFTQSSSVCVEQPILVAID